MCDENLAMADCQMEDCQMKELVKKRLEKIKRICQEEIKYDSFFTGNIQACDFAFWIEYSDYKVGKVKMPVGKCSTMDALSFMKQWGVTNDTIREG